MSQQFDAFVADLRALCLKHGVTLSSSGYDGLQVWPLRFGDDPIHQGVIEDCTDGAPTAPAQSGG